MQGIDGVWCVELTVDKQYLLVQWHEGRAVFAPSMPEPGFGRGLVLGLEPPGQLSDDPCWSCTGVTVAVDSRCLAGGCITSWWPQPELPEPPTHPCWTLL